MRKQKIPQGRSDVIAFREQIGCELIKEKFSGFGGDPNDRNECLLRYEAWQAFDQSHIKNIKTVAADAAKRQARGDRRPLRVILQDMLLANAHNYEDSLRGIRPRYLAELIVNVQEKEDSIVLSRFLDFLVKYL